MSGRYEVVIRASLQVIAAAKGKGLALFAATVVVEQSVSFCGELWRNVDDLRCPVVDSGLVRKAAQSRPLKKPAVEEQKSRVI